MVIHQGDVVWVDFGDPIGSEPGHRRPALVIQSDVFNLTAINTICVAVITSNLSLETFRGNVRLAKGEANLPKPSVVNLTLIRSLDRSRILNKLGSLSKERMAKVLQNLELLFRPMTGPKPSAASTA